MRNSARFSAINCKKEKSGIRYIKSLRDRTTTFNVWIIFESQFEQTNCKKPFVR